MLTSGLLDMIQNTMEKNGTPFDYSYVKAIVLDEVQEASLHQYPREGEQGEGAIFAHLESRQKLGIYKPD